MKKLFPAVTLLIIAPSVAHSASAPVVIHCESVQIEERTRSPWVAGEDLYVKIEGSKLSMWVEGTGWSDTFCPISPRHKNWVSCDYKVNQLSLDIKAQTYGAYNKNIYYTLSINRQTGEYTSICKADTFECVRPFTGKCVPASDPAASLPTNKF